MKKFSAYILTLFCAIMACAFVACGDVDKNITLQKSSVEMYIGESVDLSSFIALENIQISQVRFFSVDPSIVSIKNQTTVVANKSGATIVQASYENQKVSIEVLVLGEAVIASAPEGLTYNAEGGFVTWNPVLVTVSGQVAQVNSYDVEIDRNGILETKTVIGNNKIEITDSGIYKIRVKSNALVTNGKTIYRESAYCNGIDLKKLESPTNVVYDDDTKVLSWDKIEGTVYQVKINGVLSEQTSENSMVVDLTKQNMTSKEKFDVSVINVGHSQNEEIIISGESEVKSYYRFYAPQMTIQSGVIKWDAILDNNIRYEITRTTSSGTEASEIVNTNEYKLTGIAAGEYLTISLRVIGNSQYYLASENISELTNVTKLAGVTLDYNIDSGKVFAYDYLNKKIELEITFKGQTEKITLVNGEYVWNKTEPGDYSIKAYVYAKAATEINSDASNEIQIRQLAKVSNVYQEVNSSGEYYVSFEDVVGAFSYELSYFDGTTTRALSKAGNGTYGMVDSIFNNAQSYYVYVKALPAQSQTGNMFVLPSVKTLEVIRHPDLTVSSSADQSGKLQTISWNQLSNIEGYKYEIYKNTVLDQSSTITSGSFNVSSFDFGNYVFKVKAVGLKNADIIYLDSLNFASEAFSVEKQLSAPEISFNRQTKVVTVTKVEHADNYQIYLNGNALVFDNSQSDIKIDITDEILQVGTYHITVKAVNEFNPLLLDSLESSITITKLDVPKQVTLTDKGVITIGDYPNSDFLDTTRQTILVNGENTNALVDSGTFNVKLKFNAKQERVLDTYYLDSDFSEFTIQSLAKPNAPVLVGTDLIWPEISDSKFVYMLSVTQLETTKTIKLTNNSISVHDAEMQWLDLNQMFKVSVCYSFVTTAFDISVTSEVPYTSPYSNETEINRLISELEIVVIDNGTDIYVSWQRSEVEDVVYRLSIDGTTVYTGQDISFNATSYFVSEKQYIVTLIVTKDSYLTSNNSSVSVERLKRVNQIEIANNEDIIVDTQYNNDTYLVEDDSHLTRLIQLENIKITINDADVTSLSAHNGTFVVIVQLIAKSYTEGKYFYLSSNQTSFEFSRLDTQNSPVIEDNTITWETKPEVTSYRLKFEGNQKTEYLVVSGNFVSVKSPEVATLLIKLGTNDFEVSVQAIIYGFVAEEGIEYYLSSRFSAFSAMKKLLNVTNILFGVADSQNEQTNMVVSFTHNADGGVVRSFEIKLFHNNNYIDTYTINGDVFSTILGNVCEDVGKWYVEITAIGMGTSINSDVQKSYELTRLAAPMGVTIDSDALLTWNAVNNASSYIVSYYHNSTILGTITGISEARLSLSSQLLSQIFDGTIEIKIMAVGGKGLDTNRTLSSSYSTPIIATKAHTATIVMEADGFTITGDFNNDGSLSFIVTIKTDSRVIESKTLSLNTKYLFADSYKYLDTGDNVSASVNKIFTINVQTLISKANHIKSDVETATVTKLKTVQSAGFIRDSGIDPAILFSADTVPNASRYVLTVGAYTTDALLVNGGKISIAIQGELSLAFASAWSLVIYAQGEIREVGTSYINSSKTVITGTKLSTITTFKTVNGELTWNKIDAATDYILRISDTEVKTGYVLGNNHTLKDKLEGKSGTLTLNIKARGNIGTSLVTTNIILDSEYILDNESRLKNYECYKLEMVENLRVIDGYLTFDFIEKTEMYEAVVDGKNFALTLISPPEDIVKKMYSDAMYKNIANNTTYNLTIKSVSTSEDIIYSDTPQAIQIKILPNASADSAQIVHKIKTPSPITYDYTISQFIWDDYAGAINGYKVKILNDIIPTLQPSFTLDLDRSLASGFPYSASMCISGSSQIEQDGTYHLNSPYSAPINFTKLDSPVPYVENGMLKWTAVSGANGYFVYLDGALFNENMITGLSCDLFKANLSNNQKYNHYEVRAISTSSQFIASSKGLYCDEDGLSLEVVKLKAPSNFSVMDGTLQYTINLFTDLLPLILSGETQTPFTTTLEDLPYQLINIKLKNNETLMEYVLEDYAGLFVYLTQSQKNTLKGLGATDEQIDFISSMSSWPSLNYNYLDQGNEIPAGEYNLSTRQLGDNYKYITSNYGSEQEVYIPYAPQIEVKYNANDEYILSWNSITIPSKYSPGTVKYVVAVTTASGDNVVLEETTLTQLNLTECVRNGSLLPSMNSIFVYVKGNSSKILNGKISNIIDMVVLDSTTAMVHNGELSWNAQTSATGYNIFYYPIEDNQAQTSLFVTEANWNCAELSSMYSYYRISIQAVGIKLGSKTFVTISGKVSAAGKISKLTAPTATVNNGVFEWNNITNSSGYRAYTYTALDQINDVYPIGLTAQNATFESPYTQPNLKYRFMAIGTLDMVLNSESLAYVNSDESAAIIATTMPAISNILATDGKLTWTTLKNNGAELTHYKLIFTRIDEYGNELNNAIIIDGSNFRDGVIPLTCSYDCSDLLEAGLYGVTIQAYYTNADNRGKYDVGGTTAYYLMSVKSIRYEFTKLAKVENIDIRAGEITWDYSGEVLEDVYEYELTFTANTQNGLETFVFIAEENRFSSYIVNQLVFVYPFTLQVKVVPKQGVTNFVSSNITEYKNSGIDVEITQIKGVLDSEIKIIKHQDFEDLFISWEDYQHDIVGLSVEYLIKYWNSEDSTPMYTLVSEKEISTADLSFSINEAYSLFYQIQVIPKGNMDILPSYLSDVREIRKPQAIQNILYDAVSGKFSWDSYASSLDHNFKVKDEVVEVDSFGNPKTDIDGSYIISKTYLFTTISSTDCEYIPLEQGYHIISVAVIVKNAEDEGSLTSSYTYYYNNSAEQFTGTAVKVALFGAGSGDGTSENPYTIETTVHFANMTYRLNKPAYENSYKLTLADGTETSIKHTQANNLQFNFLQTENISSVTPFGITDQTVTFRGTYDGNYKSLSWAFDFTKTTANRGVVALFDRIAANAEVKNLQIYVSFVNNLARKASISLVANENNGTISNVTIGTEGLTISITTNYNLIFNAVNTNNGIISKVVTKYNVTLANSTSVSGNSLAYAGIAYINNNVIRYCANIGRIDLTAVTLSAGGIVASNNSAGVIEGCTFKGVQLRVNIAKLGTNVSVLVKVGGIAGENKGNVHHCYVTTIFDVVINVNSNNPTIYVAGLIGEQTLTNVSYSYVSVSKTGGSITDGLYQLIGSVLSVSSTFGSTCQYKTIAGFAVSKDSQYFNPTAYTTVPTGLNAGGTTYFTETVQQLPELVWESAFAQDWLANS